MKNVILGISCFYHDSAAALIVDGKVIAAAQEERFSRIKHDSAFPTCAVKYCLEEGGISIDDVEHVVFYEKPLLKFERLLQTYIHTWPRGIRSFRKAMTSMLHSKLWVEKRIREECGFSGEVLFTEHHYAHAASAYYCSEFDRAAILTMDGVGEWDTTTIGYARGSRVTLTHGVSFPHSLGLFYSAFTSYLGFKVNSGEYKLMGLAPYGTADAYYEKVRRLIDQKEDGSFQLDMRYFSYAYGLRMTNKRFHDLFGGAPRGEEEELTKRHKDIAAAVQKVTEEVVLALAEHVRNVTGETRLCLSGGVALNCVANGKLLESGLFERMYIQPASGDAGGAVGAALYVYYEMLGKEKHGSAMPNAYIGPSYTEKEIEEALASVENISYERLNSSVLYEKTAHLLEEGCIVGWFQGRMEYGPRALGNRSILADPRNETVRDRINKDIKFRESFRPFAPAVLEEHASTFFSLSVPSPYMLVTANASAGLPAVTHVDGSARIQTVGEGKEESLRPLLQAFYRRTGCPALVNTSYNVRGEPMVMTPRDALACFLSTHMDYLVLGSMLVQKKKGNEPLYTRSFESD